MALVPQHEPLDTYAKDASKLDGEEVWNQQTDEGTTTLATETALTTLAFWNDFDASSLEIDGFWRAEIEKREPDEPINDPTVSRVVAFIMTALQQATCGLASAIGGSDEDLMKESAGPHPMLGSEVVPAPFYEDGDGDLEVAGPHGHLACEGLMMD